MAVLASIAIVIAAVWTIGSSDDRAGQSAASQRPITRHAPITEGVTLWGGTAHTQIAASRDCADLQSWFDAAEAQYSAYLEKVGPGDPNTDDALDVMVLADDRMRDIGCYD